MNYQSKNLLESESTIISYSSLQYLYVLISKYIQNKRQSSKLVYQYYTLQYVSLHINIIYQAIPFIFNKLIIFAMQLVNPYHISTYSNLFPKLLIKIISIIHTHSKYL